MLEMMQEMSGNNGARINVAHTKHECERFVQMSLQFIQDLLDNLSSRFPDKEILEAGAVLNPNSWPANDDERLLFGDREVLRLAEICHVDKCASVADFRLYNNYNQRQIGQWLSSLMQRVKLLPISSAECERRFSCMNMGLQEIVSA